MTWPKNINRDHVTHEYEQLLGSATALPLEDKLAIDLLSLSSLLNERPTELQRRANLLGDLERRRNENETLKEYQTFWKLATHLAMHHYDSGNASDYGLDLVYLNWDQNHPLGDMFVVKHHWAHEEKLAYRKTRLLPSALDLATLAENKTKGILIRYYCRGYRRHRLNSLHLPLLQCPAELSITSQKFMVLGAPDKDMQDDFPISLILLPSGFIDFPVAAQEESERSAAKIGSLPEYTLCLLVGHTQPSEGFTNINMVKDGVKLSNFWLPTDQVFLDLSRVLDGLGTFVHPEVPQSSLNVFEAEDYLVEASLVVGATLDYGCTRDGDQLDCRATGFYNKLSKE
jgi:hypothetical protein